MGIFRSPAPIVPSRVRGGFFFAPVLDAEGRDGLAMREYHRLSAANSEMKPGGSGDGGNGLIMGRSVAQGWSVAEDRRGAFLP